MSDLSAASVAARLEKLRSLHVPVTAKEARLLMEAAPDAGAGGESFARGVARRLGELRALCELAAHLHRASRAPVRR